MKLLSIGVAVALFACSSVALICYASGGDGQCPGKDGAKCGAGQTTAKAGTACQRFAALTTSSAVKADDKCCSQATVSICAEKAQAVAMKLRAESCPIASAAILASALPEIKCPEARSKLMADVKGKACEKEAAQTILAALKDASVPAAAVKEGTPAPKGNVLATTGKEGAPACAKEGASLSNAGGSLAKVGDSDCCAKERAALAKAGGNLAKETACSFCPLKAEKLASAIRADACSDHAASILAEALPALTCKDAQASLVKEIKASDCSHEGAELILAASAKLTTKKTEPAKAD